MSEDKFVSGVKEGAGKALGGAIVNGLCAVATAGLCGYLYFGPPGAVAAVAKLIAVTAGISAAGSSSV